MAPAAQYDRDVIPSIIADARLASPRVSLLLMLKSYWDESGTGDQETQPVMTLAGWVFDLNEVRLFERRWRRVLKAFGVSEAKATHLRARKRDFEGWDDDRAHRFMLALSSALERSVLYGVAMSIVRGDYQVAIREHIDAGALPNGTVYKDEYTWVMQTALEHVIAWPKLRRRDRIACIFDEGKSPRTHTSFRELRDATDGPIGPSGRIIHDYRGVRSIDVCGVQAADFLASGVRLGTMDRLNGVTPGRILIQTLHMPHVEVLGGYYAADDIRAALAPLRPTHEITGVTFTPAPRVAPPSPAFEGEE